MTSDDTQILPDRETGRVAWFDSDKRYGFIQRDKTGDDIFVHLTEAKKAGMESLLEGERLSFIALPSPAKPDQLAATDLQQVIS